jgi:hypothetical protein
MAGSAAGILAPSLAATVINAGEHLGLVFIGVGMITWEGCPSGPGRWGG